MRMLSTGPHAALWDDELSHRRRESCPSVKLMYTTLRRIMPLLPERARAFLITYTVVTSALAVLDIGALALLALSLTAMVAGDAVQLPLIG